MSITVQTIRNAYSGQPGIANTTLYTVGAGLGAKVVHCTIKNDTTTAVWIKFNIVPSGGAVGADNYVAYYNLGSEESRVIWEVVGALLNAGDLISAIAQTAAQVTTRIDVVEYTV